MEKRFDMIMIDPPQLWRVAADCSLWQELRAQVEELNGARVIDFVTGGTKVRLLTLDLLTHLR
jgi:hypothetical protein